MICNTVGNTLHIEIYEVNIDVKNNQYNNIIN